MHPVQLQVSVPAPMMRPSMHTWLPALLACLLSAAGAPQAQATAQDAVESMRQVRLRGCGGHSGTRSPLRVSAQLNAAVRTWSHGVPLRTAISRSGYREDRSAGLHVSGDTAALRNAITERLCAPLTDASFDDTGVLERGQDVWIVIAAPFSAPAPQAAGSIANQVLRLVNDARLQGHVCGRTRYAPARALQLSAALTRAALGHADDMLQEGYFEHTGSNGSSPAQRVAATGYRYRRVGENIALGPESAAEAVRGWLASPGHCQNIMDPGFVDMGVAFAVSRSGEPRIYWVQDFGEPR